jgi:precorrin-6Y C5,15-methyltransferase (decarboxylating)
MNNIFCIGMGPGGAKQVTPAALETAASVPFLLGDARFLALVAAGPSVAPQHLEELPRGTEATLRRVAELLEKGNVGVLVSGDTGFYSLASSLVRRFGPEKVRLIPGLSSMQLLAARRCRSWANVPTFSLHGRTLENRKERHPSTEATRAGETSSETGNTGGELAALQGEAVVLLGGRERVPAQLRELANLLGPKRKGALAWDLGLPEESIMEGTLAELAIMQPRGRLPLLWLDPPEGEPPRRDCQRKGHLPEDDAGAAENPFPTGVLSDSWFFRDEGIPLTKAPVRAALLGLLHPLRGCWVLEIGTGTGGMTVELARAAGPEGMVFSVEPKQGALALAARNCLRADIAVEMRTPRGEALPFPSEDPTSAMAPVAGSAGSAGCATQGPFHRNIANDGKRAGRTPRGRVCLLQGSAPEALGGLRCADAVFVGGHGGALPEVLAACWRLLRPGGRLAATFILMDAALTALRTLENLGGSPNLWQLTAGYGKPLAGSWMLTGQNPVFLVWGDKEAEQA